MPTETYDATTTDWSIPTGDSREYEKAESGLYRTNLTELKPYDKAEWANGTQTGNTRKALRFIFTAREVLETNPDMDYKDSHGEPFQFAKGVNLVNGQGDPISYYHASKPGISNSGLVDLTDALIDRQLSKDEARVVSLKRLFEEIVKHEISYKTNVTRVQDGDGAYNRLESISLIKGDKPKIEAIITAIKNNAEVKLPPVVQRQGAASPKPAPAVSAADMDDPFAD